MKVILLEDVKGTGKKGQVLEVSDGHARNFLLPRKLAVEATKASIADLDAKQKQADHKLHKELAAAQALAAQLKDKAVRISVRVGENGKMFGSVTNKEIAEAIQSQLDVTIDRKKIVLSDPVRATGRYTVPVKLHPQVSAQVTFDVSSGSDDASAK